MNIAKFSGIYDTRFEDTSNGDVIESKSGKVYLVNKPKEHHSDRHNAVNVSNGGRVCFNSYTKVCVHKEAVLHLKEPQQVEDFTEFNPSEEVIY